MPRIRTIKPEFWQDEKLAPLSPLERLVFLGLICMADDAGRLLDNIKHIDGQLFPETDDSSREPIETLARLSRVIRYTSSSGQRLIQIARWENHQKVDNPAKKVLPAPTAEDIAAAKDSASLAKPSREPSEKVARVSRSDLGPRTVDLGPKDPPVAPQNGAGWVQEAVADYEEANEGTITHGHVGRALKPLVKRHTWAVVRPEWQRWVRSPDAGFGPEVFARTFGQSRSPPGKVSAAEQSLRNSEIAFGLKLR